MELNEEKIRWNKGESYLRVVQAHGLPSRFDFDVWTYFALWFYHDDIYIYIYIYIYIMIIMIVIMIFYYYNNLELLDSGATVYFSFLSRHWLVHLYWCFKSSPAWRHREVDKSMDAGTTVYDLLLPYVWFKHGLCCYVHKNPGCREVTTNMVAVEGSRRPLDTREIKH